MSTHSHDRGHAAHGHVHDHAHHHAAEGPGTGLVDPVCGMQVTSDSPRGP